MANTFSWDCKDIVAYSTHTDENGVTQSNVIFRVHWQLNLTDGTNTVKRVGSSEFDVSDLSSFTSYESLTTAQVSTWIEAAIGEDRLTRLKSSLESQLAQVGLQTPAQVVNLQIGD